MSVHGTTWSVYRAQPWEPALPQPWEPQSVTPYEPQSHYYDEFAVEPWQYELPVPPTPEGLVPWEPSTGGGMAPTPWDGQPPKVPLPGEPGWPGLDVALDPPAPGTTPTTAREPLGAGDHVGHGARSMVVPGLLGGMIGGAFAAGAAQELKGLTFAAHTAKGLAGGIATGAAMGLLVAASSPTGGDDLGARYAVAGGAIGVTAGLLFNRGAGAGMNTAITAGTNAVLGWFIGNRLEQPARTRDS